MIKILEYYGFKDDVIDIKPFGNGNINKTFLVRTNSKVKYILQEINTKVFKKPEEVMKNIELVTNHIKNIHHINGINSDNAVLEIFYTLDNESFVSIDKHYWRAYKYVSNSMTYETTEDPELFKQVGIAIGAFQNFLTGFDPNKLFVTIPDFHDTPKRYEALRKAIDIDNYDRAINVYNEIKFIVNRKDKLSIVTDALEKKEIPLRVTHNDTKLNNIMIDKDSKKAVCVIDLDTVMPGSALYDFGDAVRIGASTAKEDEKDVSKIHLNIELFEAFAQGFLDQTLDILTPLEVDLLVDSVWLITMEITMRFLTDYLENDQYFKTDYAEHNIIRARAQMKLVEEIEKHYEEMKMIIKKLIRK